MNKKYSIGFILLLLTVLVLISGAYEFSYDMAKEKAREEKLTDYQNQTDGNSLETDGTAKKADCFYLFEEHGFITVYLSDKETVFEYTSIEVNDLPDELITEIQNGKYVKDVDELYNFLETYSS